MEVVEVDEEHWDASDPIPADPSWPKISGKCNVSGNLYRALEIVKGYGNIVGANGVDYFRLSIHPFQHSYRNPSDRRSFLPK